MRKNKVHFCSYIALLQQTYFYTFFTGPKIFELFSIPFGTEGVEKVITEKLLNKKFC